MKNCSHNHVCDNCADFKPFTCNRRDRSPGACNGCSKYTYCRYDKYRYKADFSHKKYREDLVDSRTGINMSYEECKAMADIIVPLIKAGHSPYHIVTNHPELNISEKRSTTILKMVSLENLDFSISILESKQKEK